MSTRMTMDDGHGVVPHHVKGSISYQHLMVPIVEHSFNVDVKNILIYLETLTCFPSSCFPNTSNIVSFATIEPENSVPRNILVDISIKRWGVFSILHFP